ncbi:MAG: glycosyltransferase [Desulfomonilaceae bacterium]
MNPKRPTVSIITASLNSGATIRDCAQSIRKQTCPVEHIIVDGLSTDETLAVAEKYARSDATIISERDDSLYEAINKGIALSTGDIIGTLNSDDFYPHSRIISIVQEVFKNSEIDACYGDLVYVDRKDTSRIVRYWRSSPYSDKLMNNGWMPPHPTFFARRSVYEKHGTYRLDMGTAADYEFLLRALVVNRIRVLYLPTLITVMRTGGVSSSSLGARLRANRMDRKAWFVNHLQPKPWTLLAKPIRKSTQYFFKKTYGKPWLDDEFLGKTDAEDKAEPEKSRTLSLRENNYDDPAAAGIREMPPFYVVTVNYHNENRIIRMIESLRSVDLVKKLIIVDHSGSDILNSINSDFPISVIPQPNRGYGAGLNRGLRQIPDQDALVMLCNPDTAILNPEKLQHALHYMNQSPEIGCLIPRLLTREGASQPAARRFYTLSTLLTVRNPWILKRWPEFLKEHYYSEDLDNGPYEIDWGSGSTMFVRNSLFPYPISFDERFFLYFEDVDLCAQIWDHGFSVVYYPDLIVNHDGARLSRRSFHYLAVHLTSLLKFIYKYRGLFNRRRFTASE